MIVALNKIVADINEEFQNQMKDYFKMMEELNADVTQFFESLT